MSNTVTTADTKQAIPGISGAYMAPFAVLDGSGSHCIAFTYDGSHYPLDEVLGDTYPGLTFEPTRSNYYDLDNLRHGSGAWNLEHAVRELEEPGLIARWLRIFHGVKAQAVLFRPDKSSWVEGVVFGNTDDETLTNYIATIRDYMSAEIFEADILKRCDSEAGDDFDEVDFVQVELRQGGLFGYKSQAQILATFLSDGACPEFKLEGARVLRDTEYNLWR